MTAIFERDGDAFVPTVHALGPWNPTDLHGGAVLALAARAIEHLDAPVPMRVTRVTFEFLGPVRLEPVSVEAEVVRPGKRLQMAEATLTSEGRPAIRARAVRMRRGDVAVPQAPREPPPSGPEDAQHISFPIDPDRQAFHTTGMEIRFSRGSFSETGPALGWFRLAKPLVAGEDPSPLQRTCAAADFGNGISRILEWGGHLFVNTDLSVHLVRDPAGEWVGLDARTVLGQDGTGLATSRLLDATGDLGVAAQSLYVEAR